MAESTAVAEEVVTTPVSTVDTPVSPAVLETPSTQETPSDSTGTETLGTDTSEEAPKPLAEWTLTELRQKAYESGLSSEEIRRRDSLEQSENDRRSNEERQRQQTAWEQQQQLQQLTTAYDTAAEAITAEFNAAIARGQDRDLTIERATRKLGELKDQAALIAQAPVHNVLNQWLLDPSLYGDSAQNRKTLGSLTIEDKIKALVERTYITAKATGPDQSHEVVAKTDLDPKNTKSKYISREEHQKAIDALKAANPGWAASTNGSRGVGGGWTYSRYMNATPEERRDIPADTEARLIREESRRRTART